MPVSRSNAPQEFELDIVDLSHDGRGVARREGKAMFVAGALPGERVRARLIRRHRNFDEGETLAVLAASPDRVEPRCAHFRQCAGCVLQHLDAGKQIQAKQKVLLENLERIGHVSAERILPPLTADSWGYRRKGRLSVRWVEKKGKTVVGFRETNPRFVADVARCEVVVPEIGTRIGEIAAMVDRLDGKREIPQIEFIAGDGAVALVFRHLNPLSGRDTGILTQFAQDTGLAVFLQPGGVDSVRPLWPQAVPLSFRLADSGIELAFRPLDFIQVNAAINDRMIAHALDLLDPQAGDRVLDLFCGLGNFTLPLARRAGRVVGVEGEAGLVQRARDNAAANGIGNVEFFTADLAKDLAAEPWMRDGFDKLLLDPPRSGADVVLAQLPLDGIDRIVYVSCHPGSLARDAGFLVRERGYTLKAAGVMDMFPHTAHVESIALFER
ncbi:23S rRNA (uracil(1939)-C(5))-methyltransferase RlmD [Rehaibacterium terrae]|jgi:23S rRNA (uracil1939-C5)-methyltransferase|uniref:23S rRNA (uracil(1939)-C(5))-methyltransferase RlmD n=1 Tax=Rehaibacterium terrae TaxID=1341696 RepID=UPI001622FD84|nr:23S rRNA (uracil(1939)-C(5))-methyltransferase RlmD [Rehaibacterium terrae]